MIESFGHLEPNVSKQRAAQRDIYNLMASANGQKGLALGKNRLDEQQLTVITFTPIGSGLYRTPHLRRQTVSVQARIHVISPGEQDAIAAPNSFGDHLRGSGRR